MDYNNAFRYDFTFDFSLLAFAQKPRDITPKKWKKGKIKGTSV
jgi:hypothetical protein